MAFLHYCGVEFSELISLLPLNLGVEGQHMKKIALALVVMVASLSLAGCFVGKGKGKAPPPIVTKG